MNEAEWNELHAKVTSTPAYRALHAIETHLRLIDEEQRELDRMRLDFEQRTKTSRDSIRQALSDLDEMDFVLPPEIDGDRMIIVIDPEWYEHEDVLSAIRWKPQGQIPTIFRLAEQFMKRQEAEKTEQVTA